MVLWNKSVWLYAVTLLLAVLFINLRSTASTPLAHLLLHLPQALIQQVSLQQTGQLVLRKISRILKKELFKGLVLEEMEGEAIIWEWTRINCTCGGFWYIVRRLLENSFMSLSISCFISGGRLANSSELMSTELGLSYNSPCICINVKYFQNGNKWNKYHDDSSTFATISVLADSTGSFPMVTILPDTCYSCQPSPPTPCLLHLNCKKKQHQNEYLAGL